MMSYYPSGMSRSDLQYLGEIPSRYVDEAPDWFADLIRDEYIEEITSLYNEFCEDMDWHDFVVNETSALQFLKSEYPECVR